MINATDKKKLSSLIRTMQIQWFGLGMSYPHDKFMPDDKDWFFEKQHEATEKLLKQIEKLYEN